MNNLDEQYINLLQDILDNGVEKSDRTGTGTKSVFGRQIRHKMSDGFPLLTTKKMPFKTIVTELLWFLRGDTNIKWLVENGCNIWNGDAYKFFKTEINSKIDFKTLDNLEPLYDKGYLQVYGKNDVNGRGYTFRILSQEEFIERIKIDYEFAKKWGELGPIYGKQWRSWRGHIKSIGGKGNKSYDQIKNLIEQLKTNPDSRRLMVNVWNVGELDQMVLPPCHYGFQVYTRELSLEERKIAFSKNTNNRIHLNVNKELLDEKNVPTRKISLMWNQRSVDTFLGLPFNIASYGLLLEIIAKEVNMVPDELIGNLGDTHLYLNHIEQAIKQMGSELSLDNRLSMVSDEIKQQFDDGVVNVPYFPNTPVHGEGGKMLLLDDFYIPRRTRQPFDLPTLNPLPEYKCILDNWECYEPEDITLSNYKSHGPIKAPLSN